MAETASVPIHYRARYVRQLSDAAAHFHADCSGGRSGLTRSIGR
jgi:hypothetical protein